MPSNPNDELAIVRELRRQRDELQQENVVLKGGGGGGTSGGMERVAKLEAHVETLRADMASTKKDIGDIRVDIGVIKEKISQLPSKGFIVTVTLTALGVLTFLALFESRIRALFGLV